MTEHMNINREDLFREDVMDKDTIYDMCEYDISEFEKDTVDILNKFNKNKLVKANKYNMNVNVEVDLKEFIRVSNNTGSLVFYIIDYITIDDFNTNQSEDARYHISYVDNNENKYVSYLNEYGAGCDILDKTKRIRFYTVCDGVCLYSEYITEAMLK